MSFTDYYFPVIIGPETARYDWSWLKPVGCLPVTSRRLKVTFSYLFLSLLVTYQCI